MIVDCPGFENPQTTWCLPESIYRGLRNWMERGDCGGFLRACLANDFTAAVCRADDESLACLRPIAKFIHNEMPSNCHGSKEAVDAWRNEKRGARQVEIFGGVTR